MNTLTRSHYNKVAWLAAFGLFMVLWLIFGGVALILALCGAPTKAKAVLAGVLLCVGMACLNMAMAFTASMHALHPAGTVIFALIANVVAGPLIAVLFSNKFAVLFRRPPGASSKLKAEDDDDGTVHGNPDRDDTELDPSPAVPAAGHPPHTATVKYGVSPKSSNSSNSFDGEGGHSEELHIPRHRLTLIRDAILGCLIPHLLITYAAMVVVIVLTHLLLADGCYCGSPNEFNTWASRSSGTPTCKRNEICHVIGNVGSHCTDIVVVADYVAADADAAPDGATLEWGDAGSSFTAGAAAGHTGTFVVSQPTPGRLVVDHPIREDWRVVAQFPVLGLRCGTNYTFRVRFLRGGAAVAERATAFATLPGAASAVRFIGGGDLHNGDTGYGMVRRMWAAQPDSHFVWVGGDVAYANNIRYCYPRWDATLALLSEPRRPDGSRPLLMAAVGNHEAGGYLSATADTPAARRAAYTHYTTYFPSAEVLNDFVVFPGAAAGGGAPHPALPLVTRAGLPAGHVGATFATTPAWRGDDTATFYRALIGSTGWVVLDSDVMIRTEAQVAYLNETLALWAGLRAAGQMTKLVVAFHCPGLPTVRDMSDKQAVLVRRDFYPLMVRWNVSLVLEHHDHAYKRTHPIRSANADGSGDLRTAAPHEGFIVTGDGALGVGPALLGVKNRWFHAKVQNSNAGYAVELSPDGYFAFRIYNEHGGLIDEFWV